MLGDLSKKYESNGDPACISTGWGDSGGKSYGMYQLASNCGSVEHYIDWLIANGYWFGEELRKYPICSDEFDSAWQWLGTSANRDDFAMSQHLYIKSAYYDTAVANLAELGFNAENHSEVMQDVIWSRAVQYGTYYIREMFQTACSIMGYNSLSEIDSIEFDKQLIETIYLKVCHTEEWTNGSPSLRVGLYYRFETECEDALNLL